MYIYERQVQILCYQDSSATRTAWLPGQLGYQDSSAVRARSLQHKAKQRQSSSATLYGGTNHCQEVCVDKSRSLWNIHWHLAIFSTTYFRSVSSHLFAYLPAVCWVALESVTGERERGGEREGERGERERERERGGEKSSTTDTLYSFECFRFSHITYMYLTNQWMNRKGRKTESDRRRVVYVTYVQGKKERWWYCVIMTPIDG